MRKLNHKIWPYYSTLEHNPHGESLEIEQWLTDQMPTTDQGRRWFIIREQVVYFKDKNDQLLFVLKWGDKLTK